MSNEQEFKISDFKFGLMVVEPQPDSDDMVSIVHFVGYASEPTEETVSQLREELNTDETFGLVGMMDDLVILPAPEEIISYYISQYND